VTRSVSVVIPTLDEAASLPQLIACLRGQQGGGPSEIIVVDGGSRDETVALARESGVKIVHSAPGRGRQLHEGARRASGDILLFLHADSVFPGGGLKKIAEVMTACPHIAGGNFRLLFDGDDGFSRWLDGFYAWIRKRGHYYGDSGLFVRREVYETLGGIRPIALMEDYDFVRRLERFGETCCIEDPPLITSSRRFRGRHPIAIVWGWIKLHALFRLGVSPERLARIYDSTRRRERASAPQGSVTNPGHRSGASHTRGR
jgi:rSAM/selenodomain-associated transferase 2